MHDQHGQATSNDNETSWYPHPFLTVKRHDRPTVILSAKITECVYTNATTNFDVRNAGRYYRLKLVIVRKRFSSVPQNNFSGKSWMFTCRACYSFRVMLASINCSSGRSRHVPQYCGAYCGENRRQSCKIYSFVACFEAYLICFKIHRRHEL